MSSFRIALVESGASSTHIFSRTYLPRTGIPTLGAVLKEKGFACDIWFETMAPVPQNLLRTYDIVGIGSTSSTIPQAYRLADAMKGKGPIVVMGGPHVTFMPDEALNHCDYVVMGEGEGTLPALVAALESKGSLEHIKGLAFRSADGSVHRTGKADPVDFPRLPSPDYSLCKEISPRKIPPIITTSRGCPHDCTFCSVTTMFGKKYRFKEIDQVIAELQPVLTRSVCFGDDNFFAHPVRTKALLRAMIERDSVPLRWSGEMAVRAGLDEELLDLMAATHCRIVYVGIESVNPETLKSYGKAHQFEATARCIDNLHRYGIGIHGMFVVDLDDTPETIEKIVDYAIETDIDTIQICSLTPFPGTEAHRKHGARLLHNDWQYFDGMHVVARPTRCTAYELQTGIVDSLKRFYSPLRVFSSYRRNRGWRVKYRAGGHVLINRWALENRGYLSRLKNDYYTEPFPVKEAAFEAV